MMMFLVALCVVGTVSAQPTSSPHGTSIMHVYMSQGSHAAYQLVDLNKDDSLTLKEFETYFNRLDDGDGKISLAEFIKATNMMASMAHKEFKLLDKDHSGFLTRDEVKAIYNSFDEDGNHSVTEKEFVDAYNKILHASHMGMAIG